MIPGSYASPEAIAHIMVQKFVMGSPLYRQEQEWSRAGVKLSRQTMSNWILRAAEDWLRPVYDQLHRELVGREVLHADETTLQVLREPGKSAQSKSYMWLYRTGCDAEHPIVLYEYRPNRRAENAAAFLRGFTGYLHADGYSGYHKQGAHIRELKERAARLAAKQENHKKLIADLLQPGDGVVLVIPIDSAAPKGRRSLPPTADHPGCPGGGGLAPVLPHG